MDAGDNDSFRFWSYLFTALYSLISKEEPCSSPNLSPSGINEEALIALIDQVIVDIPQDFFLVLDDYHWITNPTIHKSITYTFNGRVSQHQNPHSHPGPSPTIPVTFQGDEQSH